MVARCLIVLAGGLLLVACAARDERLQRDEWIEVSTPNFTLTSNASVKRTEEIARSLELFRNVVLSTSSIRDTGSSVPTLIYVFRDRTTLRAFTSWSDTRVGGFFLDRSHANYAVALASGDLGREIAQHEYVHYLLAMSRYGYPRWYNEGFAEFLSTVEAKRKSVHLGTPPTGAAGWLKNGPAMSLRKLVESRSMAGWTEQVKGAFYAKAWLLTHYLHFEEGMHEHLIDFLREWNAGTPTDQAFENAFGLDYGEAERRLRRYMSRLRYAKLPRKDYEKQFSLETVGLPTAKALSRLGDLLLALGDDESLELASGLYERSLAEDPDLASAHAGLAQIRTAEEADVHIERALALAPSDANVRRSLGDVYLQRAEDIVRSRNKRLGEAADDPQPMAARAREHYLRCLDIAPRLPACHANLGAAERTLGNKVAAARSMEEAYTLLPSSFQIRIALARFYAKEGFAGRAGDLAREAVAMAHGTAQAEAAQKLLSRVEGAAVEPPATDAP